MTIPNKLLEHTIKSIQLLWLIVHFGLMRLPWWVARDSDGTFAIDIDWEDPEIQQKIRGTMDFLIKGRTFKKGAVATGSDGIRREATVAQGVSGMGV